MPDAAALRAFARERELRIAELGELRELTPALVTGPRGGVPVQATGLLAPGLEGTICHHVYGGSGGRRDSTIVLGQVPESLAFIPALVCRDRERMGQEPEQLPAERWTPIELESTAFNERYRLAVLAGQDPGLVRELFSPSLIAWLGSAPPPGFSFELNQGHLTVALPGHLADPAEIGRFCGLAAEVRDRIRAEMAEEVFDPDLFDESEKLRDVERGLREVEWEVPPETAAAAVDAYRLDAQWKPRVLLISLLWTLGLFAVAAGIATLVAGRSVGVLTGVIVAVPLFMIARLIAASRYRWGKASIHRVGLEAFVREYARSRNLRLENRWRFHSDHRSVPMPGFADHVLAGALPGTGLEGHFVMLGNAAELRSLGQEMAYTSDRPLAASALLVRADREPLSAEGIELPEDYHLEIAGRDVCVWRSVHGSLLRTAAGSDRFCAKAGEVIQRVLGPGGETPPQGGG